MENKTKIKKQTPFWNLYKGELKKSIAIPFLVGIIVVYLLFLLITHAMFNSIVTMIDEVEATTSTEENIIADLDIPGAIESDGTNEPDNFDFAYYMALSNASQSDGTYIFKSEDDINLALNLANSEKKAIDAQKKKEGIKFYVLYMRDPYYALRVKVNTLKEIKENHMNKKISLLSNGSSGFFDDNSSSGYKYYDFYKMASGMLISIISIYGVVVAARAYSTEFRTGTIKMLMVRPITRNQLTTAKLCAVVTNVTFVYIVVSMITLLTSLRYEKGGGLTLFSFNAGAFSLAPAGTVVIYTMLLDYVSLLSWTLFSFAISTLFKHLVPGIVAYMFLPLIGSILHFINLDLVDIGSNMSWSPYLSGSAGPTAIYSNFFITLTFWAIYVVGSIVLTYYIVNKRDLA